MNPGCGARAKAVLNRLILTSRWAQFHQRLLDKTLPGTVIVVPAHNTSRACPQCGHTSAENRESQAVFHCTQCGHTTHADTNAARNILTRGLTTAGTPPNPRTSGDRPHTPHTHRVGRGNQPNTTLAGVGEEPHPRQAVWNEKPRP